MLTHMQHVLQLRALSNIFKRAPEQHNILAAVADDGIFYKVFTVCVGEHHMLSGVVVIKFVVLSPTPTH